MYSFEAEYEYFECHLHFCYMKEEKEPPTSKAKTKIEPRKEKLNMKHHYQDHVYRPQLNLDWHS
jgi:hypothetical protein